MEAAGQLFHRFRDGLDYAFTPTKVGGGACYPAQSAAGSWGLPRLAPRQLHESLQGRPEVGPLPTPRRYRLPPLPAPSGFADVSPVVIPPSRVDATLVDRTRVRKPYVQGPTCLSRSIVLAVRYPTGREIGQPAQVCFSGPALSTPALRSCENDAWNLGAQARPQPDGTLLGFKQRVRSCRRWQLSVCKWIYEGSCTSACTLGFATHVETGRPLGSLSSLRPLWGLRPEIQGIRQTGTVPVSRRVCVRIS